MWLVPTRRHLKDARFYICATSQTGCLLDCPRLYIYQTLAQTTTKYMEFENRSGNRDMLRVETWNVQKFLLSPSRLRYGRQAYRIEETNLRAMGKRHLVARALGSQVSERTKTPTNQYKQKRLKTRGAPQNNKNNNRMIATTISVCMCMCLSLCPSFRALSLPHIYCRNRPKTVVHVAYKNVYLFYYTFPDAWLERLPRIKATANSEKASTTKGQRPKVGLARCQYEKCNLFGWARRRSFAGRVEIIPIFSSYFHHIIYYSHWSLPAPCHLSIVALHQLPRSRTYSGYSEVEHRKPHT